MAGSNNFVLSVKANPDLKGNISDYATINELICLSNMENINAVLINEDVPQSEGIIKLNQMLFSKCRCWKEIITGIY